MKWIFRQLTPGEPTRDPIVGEFFSTEAIRNPAQALVREGIQNALDAGLGKQVQVRLFLAIGRHALSGEVAQRWFAGAEQHLHAKGNGLRDVPSLDDDCPYLVFEDFGTTGLSGTVDQCFDDPDTRNAFFYFFRAEGRSGKGESDRGRWGVGKHVFPRSSRISAFFGMTVRANDPNRLLMGRAVLRSHRVSGEFYSPDAYFGEQLENRLVVPVTDPGTLDQFSSDFSLRRRDEPGLSIVVPFVDTETNGDSVLGQLKQAVLADYYYAIVGKKLSVTLETPDESFVVDASTIDEIVAKMKVEERGDLADRIALGRWAVAQSDSEKLKLTAMIPAKPQWSDGSVPPDLVQEMRNRFTKEDKIGVRISLTTKRTESAEAEQTHFDVYLWQQDSYDSGRPAFVREGIMISDIRADRARGMRSLVVVEHKPLATLLGDSENPAHTQWQRDSSNFKGKYVNGPAYLSFVTNAVSRLANALRVQENQVDKLALLSVFSLASEDENNSPRRPEGRTIRDKGQETGNPPYEIHPKKQRFKLMSAPGGFSIVPTESGGGGPKFIDIRCAYDTRTGNPLKRYEAAYKSKAPDFQLGHGGIKVVENEGVDVIETKGNQMRIRIGSGTFSFSITGFDKNRDLYVAATEVEAENDSAV